MKISQIPALVEAFYKARRVTGFFGAPGIGKTMLVRQGAEGLSKQLQAPVPVVELHLASMSEVDVRGFLVPVGQESLFTSPPFWREVQRSPRGILFLDEFPQAPHEVQKAVAPLLLDRCVGEYKLPDGWGVVVAGNRLSDNAGANSLLSHVLNRMAYVEVEPEPEAWIAWAASRSFDPVLLAFAKLRPAVVFSNEPPADDTPWCSPRSLHAVDDLARVYGGVEAMLASESGRAATVGLIGGAGAAELTAIVSTAKLLPDYEAIIADPDGIALPEKADQKYVALTMLAMRCTDKTAKAAMRYMERFDPNFALIGIVMLVQRLPQAAVHAAKWVTANRDMLGGYRQYLT